MLRNTSSHGFLWSPVYHGMKTPSLGTSVKSSLIFQFWMVLQWLLDNCFYYIFRCAFISSHLMKCMPVLSVNWTTQLMRRTKSSRFESWLIFIWISKSVYPIRSFSWSRDLTNSPFCFRFFYRCKGAFTFYFGTKFIWNNIGMVCSVFLLELVRLSFDSFRFEF